MAVLFYRRGMPCPRGPYQVRDKLATMQAWDNGLILKILRLELSGCIADLLGPMAKRPGYLGCQCPACVRNVAPDFKLAAANDRGQDD